MGAPHMSTGLMPPPQNTDFTVGAHYAHMGVHIQMLIVGCLCAVDDDEASNN